MNATFTLLEMRRITRDWAGMFFTAVLPAFFYLIFGATVDAKERPSATATSRCTS